ncbi:MAG: hypothetical protein H0U12_13090 [Thermoleophilaceae bacterium]|nr:hypothetical protein [Thermoleophilaceae bacterium]
MVVAADLLSREALLLLLLGALGSGPAALLPPCVPTVARVALAPALGLAAGSALLVTAAHLISMATAAWLVAVPGVVVSVAVAAAHVRHRPEERKPCRLRADAAAVAVLLVTVGAGFNAPLVTKDTQGPFGYNVADFAFYTSWQAALERDDVRAERHGPPWDLSAEVATTSLRSAQFQWGSTAVPASANALFDWRPSDSQSAYLVTLALVAALGAFAAIRTVAGAVLPALLGGLLAAGPVAYQLYVDSEQGALTGMALMPAAVLIALLTSRRAARPWLLLGLVGAGMLAVYPLWATALALAAAAVVAVEGLVRAHGGRLQLRFFARSAGFLTSAATVAALLSPAAIVRTVRYLHFATTDLFDREIANLNLFPRRDLPQYDLGLDFSPGWLLQTHHFYDGQGLAPWVVDIAGPIALAMLAAYGIWRFGGGWVLLVVMAISTALALYSWAANDCTHCAARALLLMESPVSIAVALGVAAVAAAKSLPPWLARTVAALAGAAILVAVASVSWSLEQKTVDADRFLSADVRALLPQLDGWRGSVHLEALEADLSATAYETPAIYAAVKDADTRVSVGAESNPGRPAGQSALLTLGRFRKDLRGPEFDPRYDLVLTPLASVENTRRTLDRRGRYALQARGRPVDALVTAGVGVAPNDRNGHVRVRGPLKIWVVADRPMDARLEVELRGRGTSRTAPAAGTRTLARAPERVVLCTPVAVSTGAARLSLALSTRPPGSRAPAESRVPGGLFLHSVHALKGGCGAAAAHPLEDTDPVRSPARPRP